MKHLIDKIKDFYFRREMRKAKAFILQDCIERIKRGDSYNASSKAIEDYIKVHNFIDNASYSNSEVSLQQE